jgi:hypothetical protein
MAKPAGIMLAPQPVKFGAQWHVVGTYPGGQEEHITGFKSEADALDWIANERPEPSHRLPIMLGLTYLVHRFRRAGSGHSRANSIHPGSAGAARDCRGSRRGLGLEWLLMAER